MSANLPYTSSRIAIGILTASARERKRFHPLLIRSSFPNRSGSLQEIEFVVPSRGDVNASKRPVLNDTPAGGESQADLVQFYCHFIARSLFERSLRHECGISTLRIWLVNSRDDEQNSAPVAVAVAGSSQALRPNAPSELAGIQLLPLEDTARTTAPNQATLLEQWLTPLFHQFSAPPVPSGRVEAFFAQRVDAADAQQLSTYLNMGRNLFFDTLIVQAA